MIRVLLVDDQTLIRAGLRAVLDHEPGIEVAGEADDGAEALQMVRELQPEVVVMDLRMPILDGVEATRRIRADAHLTAVRILVLTTFEGDREVLAAVGAGADGFLGKSADPTELVAAVQTVAAGDISLPQPALGGGARPAPPGPPGRPPPPGPGGGRRAGGGGGPPGRPACGWGGGGAPPRRYQRWIGAPAAIGATKPPSTCTSWPLI
ncbi:response regulator, partial [Nocardia carnea]|uniref:response regulator n=1 Tax=Nocardia carnea TaxID=37328 RepID=UPI002457C23B